MANSSSYGVLRFFVMLFLLLGFPSFSLALLWESLKNFRLETPAASVVQHGITACPSVNSPLLRGDGAPATPDRNASIEEGWVGQLLEGRSNSRESLPSLSSFPDSVDSEGYALPRKPLGRHFGEYVVAVLGWSAIGSLVIYSLPDRGHELEKAREECAAAVIGRLVDVECLPPSTLDFISDPMAHDSIVAVQTDSCLRAAEESLRCCRFSAAASIDARFVWEGLSKEERVKVEKEVEEEMFQRAMWCAGEKEYHSYFRKFD